MLQSVQDRRSTRHVAGVSVIADFSPRLFYPHLCVHILLGHLSSECRTALELARHFNIVSRACGLESAPVGL